MASRPRAASVSSSSSELAVTRKPRSAVCSNNSNMDLHNGSPDDLALQNSLDVLFNIVDPNRRRKSIEAFDSPIAAELFPDFEAPIVRQQCRADASKRDAAENKRM